MHFGEAAALFWIKWSNYTKVYPHWSLQNEGYTTVQLWAGLPAQGDRGEKGRLVSQDCLHCLIEIAWPGIFDFRETCPHGWAETKLLALLSSNWQTKLRWGPVAKATFWEFTRVFIVWEWAEYIKENNQSTTSFRWEFTFGNSCFFWCAWVAPKQHPYVTTLCSYIKYINSISHPLFLQRLDGRQTYDYRKIKITFGTDYGCCFVDLGKTR